MFRNLLEDDEDDEPEKVDLSDKKELFNLS
jgi:hypothetical protein